MHSESPQLVLFERERTPTKLTRDNNGFYTTEGNAERVLNGIRERQTLSNEPIDGFKPEEAEEIRSVAWEYVHRSTDTLDAIVKIKDLDEKQTRQYEGIFYALDTFSELSNIESPEDPDKNPIATIERFREKENIGNIDDHIANPPGITPKRAKRIVMVDGLGLFVNAIKRNQNGAIAYKDISAEVMSELGINSSRYSKTHQEEFINAMTHLLAAVNLLAISYSPDYNGFSAIKNIRKTIANQAGYTNGTPVSKGFRPTNRTLNKTDIDNAWEAIRNDEDPEPKIGTIAVPPLAKVA